MKKLIIVAHVLIAHVALQTSQATVLFGHTSNDATSTFALRETASLIFSAREIPAGQHLILRIKFSREHLEIVQTTDIKIQGDDSGEWTGTIPIFIDNARPLGFYRVYAELSNNVRLLAEGTRGEGYLTYAIVHNPADRIDYGDKRSRIGMQGGFSEATNETMPLLGIRWLMSHDDWRTLEPNRAGEFSSSRKAAIAKGEQFPAPASKEVFYNGRHWRIDGISTPQRAGLPDWAVKNIDRTRLGSICSNFGPLNSSDEAAWGEFTQSLAAARSQDNQSNEEEIYQITWEPASKWCFGGTATELIKYYSLAFEKIHKADRRAIVIGPTLFPDSEETDKAQIRDLWSAGLAKYIDAFSIHPYWKYPPEPTGFVKALQLQLKMAAAAAGKRMPFYATEHGIRSESSADELDQARGDIRQTLILLGEGAQIDIEFYISDFMDAKDAPTGGYGFYSNLRPSTRFGSDRICPKPAAPALSALTFILDGSESQGPIGNLSAFSTGYKFERYGETILALWSFGNGAATNELIHLKARRATVYDWMGNGREIRVEQGTLALKLTGDPTYIVY